MSFDVRFKSGYDAGYYGQKLNQDIISFLSPWTSDDQGEMVFGGVIYKSAVLQFVEELEYVDDVLNFIFAFDLGIGKMQVGKSFRVYSAIDKADTNDPRTILISAKNHIIRVVEPEAFLANDKIIGAAKVGEEGLEVFPNDIEGNAN